MAITIEPLGGLGNQLFVYATGRALALDTGAQLHADLRNFVGYELRVYELNSFNNRIDHTYVDESYVANKVRRASRHLQSRLPSRIPCTRTFREVSWTFDPRVLNLRDGVRLIGYFQSPKYFERHATAIRAEVSSIREPSTWFQRKSDELETGGAFIGVHIRRGDYAVLPNMGLLGLDYYSNALNLLFDLVGSLPVLVFSDEPRAAQTLLGMELKDKITYVDSPADSSPIETLALMSKSHHLIMANSTFSWWSAWLGDRQDRRVICPRPWLKDPTHVDKDLLLPTWISLGR